MQDFVHKQGPEVKLSIPKHPKERAQHVTLLLVGITLRATCFSVLQPMELKQQ